MDIISFNEASTANSRIEKVNANPDSNSGIVTVPSVIATGDSVTIPAGRTAVLPNLQVDGELVIDGEVFVPSGAVLTSTEFILEASDNSRWKLTVSTTGVLTTTEVI